MKASEHLSFSAVLISIILILTIRFVPVQQASGRDVGSDLKTDGLVISVSMTDITVGEGDYFIFHTIITNSGNNTTGSLVAHLNVAGLQKSVYVDPEDWAKVRTRYIDPMEPGSSVNLSWRIHALHAGDFAVFVVILNRDTSSSPAVSDEVHVHIEKWEVMQLENVTPFAIGVPTALVVFFTGMRCWIALRRRKAGVKGPHDVN